jgi:maltodextrin utilization protein YvdJ
MTDQTTAQLQQDLAAVDELIGTSISTSTTELTVARVDAWRRIYRQVLDEHEALERIQAEQKAKGAGK